MGNTADLVSLQTPGMVGKDSYAGEGTPAMPQEASHPGGGRQALILRFATPATKVATHRYLTADLGSAEEPIKTARWRHSTSSKLG